MKRTTRPQKESRASAATCIMSRAQHFALVAPKSADVRYSVSWDETTKIPHFRRASYNLIFSSSQTEISFGFGFFDSLTHSSGQIVSGRVVFGLLWVDCSLLCCVLLEAECSIFGSELFQSVLLRSSLFSHHFSNRSACVRRRCLLSFASHRRISLEWKRLFHPGCAALFDVPHDGDF